MYLDNIQPNAAHLSKLTTTFFNLNGLTESSPRERGKKIFFSLTKMVTKYRISPHSTSVIDPDF